MRWVTIEAVTFPAQGALLVARLESVGIVCRIENEHTVVANGLWSVAVGGVHVQVPEDAVGAARRVLDGVEPGVNDERTFVDLAMYAEPSEAHGAAGVLDRAGIPHRISENGSRKRIVIAVLAEHKERAMAILEKR